MHVPVMPEETLELLGIRPTACIWIVRPDWADIPALIAQRLTDGTVIANDRDAESLRLAAANTAEWKDRICFHLGTFGSLAEAVEQAGFEKVDGMLADTGVSRLPADVAASRFFVHGGWAVGHADGAIQRHDGGRSRQSH